MTAPAPQPAPSLRDEGAILLLSCYEMGHAPLGVASPAAFLRAAGFRPAVQDLATSRLDGNAVRRARLVSISVPMHTALRLGMQVGARIRELNPSARLSYHGLYAGLNAGLLHDAGADFAVGGEHEPALLALAEALERGEDSAPHVSTPGQLAPARIARTAHPVPDRTGLPALTDYARLESPDGDRVVGYVEATRGCKHRCLHCPLTPVYDGRFFAIPVETVTADIDQLVAQGAEHITFGDPDFLNGPSHALRIVEALHQRHPGITYDATIKVTHLLRHRDLLPRLAATGCRFIVTAAESLSGEVLRHLEKGHTRTDIETALELARQAGIALRPTWVPFTPWTTLADYRELLTFVWEHGLAHHVDPVQFAIRLLVPPGSALLDSPAFTPFKGPLDADALTYTWWHPQPEMDTLHRTVSAIVEQAAADGSNAEAVLHQLYSATLAVEGVAGPVSGTGTLAPHQQPPAPRLSEPWFC